jgi:hypothetical protein
MSDHDEHDHEETPETTLSTPAVPEATSAPFTPGEPGLDLALTDMAMALRQLVQTLKSSKIEDARLDSVEERLTTLLKGVPNA